MYNRAMGRVCGLIVLLCALHARADEPPPGADLELAKAHYRTGEIYYERGRYPDAAREFEEAYRLSNKPELLYNMGKSYDGAGDHARALAVYRRWLAQVQTSPDHDTVVQRVGQLAGLVGHVKITASVAGAQVTLDGAIVGEAPLPEAIALNPGGHKLEVAREGYRTFRKSFVATPGGSVDIDAALESLEKVQVKVIEVERKEKPQPIYKRWWLWTVVGAVVAAGAITAGVLGSREPPVDGPFAQLPAVR
jgi:tetratricopeptide (TPR) repeat protein